ncbi:unnamed protein product [Lota lota]
MSWNSGFLLLLFLALHAGGSARSTGLESMTRQTNPRRLAELLSKSGPTDVSVAKRDRHRAKRSVFLHSGVRICPKETMEQVLASHQAYYQLRVCQEAVWEAFRIFLDRIPGTVEYQRWVSICQDESLCISALARNFSASEEHMEMINRRMSRRPDGRQPPRVIPTPAATQLVPLLTGPQVESSTAPSAAPEVHSTTSRPTPVDPAGPTPEPVVDPAQPPPAAPEDSELPNLVPERPVEREVGFSIDLVDPGYRELLDDPDSPQYIDLAHHLQDQMQHVFNKLPGFKDIRVLGISETVDTDSAGGVTVSYSLLFETNSPSVTGEDPEEAGPVAGETVSVGDDSGLRDMVARALRQDASLPIDMDSLRFTPKETMLPALTSTSITVVEEEPHEPDSHNDLEVSSIEPEVDNPDPAVSLSPVEKENALVTLLHPTDPEDVAPPAAEGLDPDASAEEPPSPPSASEGLTESEQKEEEEEQEEEEVPIITHVIETIHHEETGELVRHYVHTPPTASLPDDGDRSPSMIPEEDSTPADKAAEDTRLEDFPPAFETVLTAGSPGESDADGGLPVTAVAAMTGQPPTETMAGLREDEELNALPDEEEETGLVTPEPEVRGDAFGEEETGASTSEDEAKAQGQPVEDKKDAVDEVLETTEEETKSGVEVEGVEPGEESVTEPVGAGLPEPGGVDSAASQPEGNDLVENPDPDSDPENVTESPADATEREKVAVEVSQSAEPAEVELAQEVPSEPGDGAVKALEPQEEVVGGVELEKETVADTPVEEEVEVVVLETEKVTEAPVGGVELEKETVADTPVEEEVEVVALETEKVTEAPVGGVELKEEVVEELLQDVVGGVELEEEVVTDKAEEEGVKAVDLETETVVEEQEEEKVEQPEDVVVQVDELEAEKVPEELEDGTVGAVDLENESLVQPEGNVSVVELEKEKAEQEEEIVVEVVEENPDPQEKYPEEAEPVQEVPSEPEDNTVNTVEPQEETVLEVENETVTEEPKEDLAEDPKPEVGDEVPQPREELSATEAEEVDEEKAVKAPEPSTVADEFSEPTSEPELDNSLTEERTDDGETEISESKPEPQSKPEGKSAVEVLAPEDEASKSTVPEDKSANLLEPEPQPDSGEGVASPPEPHEEEVDPEPDRTPDGEDVAEGEVSRVEPDPLEGDAVDPEPETADPKGVEEAVEVLQPKAEAADPTGPPAETIKILDRLEDLGDLYFVGHAVEVVDDSNFLQPSDYSHPSRGDNLPTATDKYGYPIIDNLYVDTSTGEGEESPRTEDSQSETGVESERTAAVSPGSSETRADEDGSPKETDQTPSSSSSSSSSEEEEEESGVTAEPIPDSLPTAPGPSETEPALPSPGPSGLSGVEAVPTSASEEEEEEKDEEEEEEEKEVEEKEEEEEEEVDVEEPAVVIIEEELEERVEDLGGGSPTPPPAVGVEEMLDDAVKDLAVELDQSDSLSPESADPQSEGSGFTFLDSSTTVAPPPQRYLTTPTMTTANQGRELVVFFSLRVTNMKFSEDLFNKTSSEYRSLESSFMDMLLPYLQSNLTGFRKLEILNFREGSVVVNSRMKFRRSVPYNVTEAVQCVLEEFCSVAAQHLHFHIDSHSLDVEPADRADPCKFLACDRLSRCAVRRPGGEAECVCEPGYVSLDGLPCQSVCLVQSDRCPAGSRCEVIPGRGAVCR